MEKPTVEIIVIIIIGIVLFIIIIGVIGFGNLEKWFNFFRNIIVNIYQIFMTWTIHAIPLVK